MAVAGTSKLTRRHGVAQHTMQLSVTYRTQNEPLPTDAVILGTAKAGRVQHRLYTAGVTALRELQGTMSYCGYRPHGINSSGYWRYFAVADAHDYVTCERCLNSVNAPGFESIANDRAMRENERNDNR